MKCFRFGAFRKDRQRPLGVDRIAAEKLQGRIGRQQFGKMFLKAPGLVGFVAADRPLVQRQLDPLQENIEHLHG